MFDDMGQPSVLAAVNYILSAYGSSEVSRLKETKDAAAAEKALKQQLVTTLSVGYNFCTVRNVTLYADANQYIFLPANCLKVSVSDAYRYLLPVKQGNRLYSQALNTFEFPVNVKADITRFYQFEELPVEAATYISIQAAINFIGSKKPDDSSLRNLNLALKDAKVALENFDHSVTEARIPIYNNWRS